MLKFCSRVVFITHSINLLNVTGEGKLSKAGV